MHELSKHKNFGVRTFQAEDEIAAVCSAIGAAFGGSMAVTTSSGPGIALKGEGMGLGLILELPMIVIDVQRGGPSTGLPTKTEQSDLDDGHVRSQWRITAADHRGPQPRRLFRRGDRGLASGDEIHDAGDHSFRRLYRQWCRTVENPRCLSELPKIEIKHPTGPNNGAEFMPYERNENLARPWAIPGTPDLMHRVGGLEKQDGTGNVSYDPDNHQHMVETRARKVELVADFVDAA